MLCDLLHAKLVWMPSVCHIPNYYLQNCVYLYLVPHLLIRGLFLFFPIALSRAAFCRVLGNACEAKLLLCVMSCFKCYINACD